MSTTPHGHLTVDGPNLSCAFQTSWCRDRASLAGGLDAHHRWPISLGGPPEPTDVAGLIYLDPIHHRRQHALIRAYIEALDRTLPARCDLTRLRFVRPFSKVERDTALYAVTQWVAAGRPVIAGWPCDAAVLR